MATQFNLRGMLHLCSNKQWSSLLIEPTSQQISVHQSDRLPQVIKLIKNKKLYT